MIEFHSQLFNWVYSKYLIKKKLWRALFTMNFTRRSASTRFFNTCTIAVFLWSYQQKSLEKYVATASDAWRQGGAISRRRSDNILCSCIHLHRAPSQRMDYTVASVMPPNHRTRWLLMGANCELPSSPDGRSNGIDLVWL